MTMMSVAAVDDDAAVEELLEGVALPDPQPRDLCSICGKAPRARRGVCWSCYAKFRECSLPLPEREPAGRPPTPPLRRWLALFDTATLLQLKIWIDAILEEGRK